MSSSRIEDSEGLLNLLELSDDEVAELWDKGVREKLEEALAPQVRVNSRLMNTIYLGIMGGMMRLYAFLKDDVTVALVLTTFTFDAPMERKSLLIYALVGLFQMDDKAWKSGFDKLRVIASSLGCSSISAFTSNTRIVEMVKALNGHIEFHVTLEVK